MTENINTTLTTTIITHTKKATMTPTIKATAAMTIMTAKTRISVKTTETHPPKKNPNPPPPAQKKNNSNNNGHNIATQATMKTETISNRKHRLQNRSSIYNKKNGNIKIHMFSRNSIHPLPYDGAFSAHTNGDHDHVSRYKFYCQKDKLG